jgi:hypothetical protein
MINITRSKNIPKSLQKPEIKAYLDGLANYKLGILKEKPKPPVSYRNSDIIEAFDRQFYAKCYLTEEKFTNSHIMDIEHFISKSEDETLRYEWTNLFPAEHNANMAKPRKTPKGGYLNPCLSSDDVETEIIYSVGAFGETPRFKATNENNQKAVNTATLLDKIHNGEIDKDSFVKTKNLRAAIKKRYDTISKLIIEWQDSKITGNKQKQLDKETELKLLLSRRASFTMLMRSSDVVQQYLPKDFLD